MTYIWNKEVWQKMDKQEAVKRGCKVVGSRWVDVDKGDTSKPDYRSRLVAKEINTGYEEGLYASTPPLEALRWIISETATVDNGADTEEKVLLISDVSRAFFEAPATRKVAVTLPDEALEEWEKGSGKVGMLKMSLYGTRDAAVNFQREVTKIMTALGLEQAKYNASLYFRKDNRGCRRPGATYGGVGTATRKGLGKLTVLVHGDDFVASGSRGDIDEFRQALRRRFTVKDKIVGPRIDRGDVNETRILNRIVRWTHRGWEYEADQRHADLIVEGMGMTSAKSVKTPGEDSPTWKLEEEEEVLSSSQATRYRMMAARANYLSTDRVDIQFAVKECCRGMAAPEVRHWNMLKRLARYLAGRPRMVWEYGWQGAEQVSAYSDSDWAGCKRTARSTSGGIVMRGGHHIKSWSVTQKRVTLSSAEAELGALVKASTEAIGILQMAEGLGRYTFADVMVDSSAALAVVHRKGSGKLRHIRVGQLWVQETAENEELKYKKVHGEVNPADLNTKHLTRVRMDVLLDLTSLRDRRGRAEESLEVKMIILHNNDYDII